MSDSNSNPSYGSFPLKENYKKVTSLGQGQYGKVFLYKRKDDCQDETLPEYVAIKAINNSGDERMRQLRKREMYILDCVQKADNENIIKYFGSFEEEGIAGDTTVLVMEACNGDLNKLIQPNRVLDIKEIRQLTKQMLNGISCLHNLDSLRNEKEFIIHR